MQEKKTYKYLIRSYDDKNPIAARCSHFGECGGCTFQDVPYETQAAWKERALSELFGVDIPFERSPASYEYRTRMDFVAAFGKIGLRPRGRHDTVIDVGHCHLIPETSNMILREVRRLGTSLGIRDYDYLRHEGFLRYAVLRQAGTGETMLILVTRHADKEESMLLESLAEKLSDLDGCDSIWWVVHDGLSDLSYGECRRYWKHEYIREKLGDIEYLVGPNTFLQSNTKVAVRCFDAIKAVVSGGTVLDLYCGAGAISLYIHSSAINATGVEASGESIALAKRNAALNMVSNVQFIASDVRQFLITNEKTFDSVVIDPPRSGAGKKVMKRVAGLGASRIVYMSCNPDTFREDSAFLGGYSLTSVRGFDMFPHTPHVELIAVFEPL